MPLAAAHPSCSDKVLTLRVLYHRRECTSTEQQDQKKRTMRRRRRRRWRRERGRMGKVQWVLR